MPLYAPTKWQSDLLNAIGAPINDTTIIALNLWAQSENIPPGVNNWLATKEGGFGGSPFNKVGVMAYPSETAGVEATLATLFNGYYGAILSALRAGNDLKAIYYGINMSPWCSGCQGGHYPVAMWNELFGSGPPGPPSSPTPTFGPDLGAPDVFQAWANFQQWAHQDYPDQFIGMSWLKTGFDALQ